MSLTELRAAYDRCAAFADRVALRGDVSSHVSPFWAEILGERRNYPTFDEMLVMRRGFTYPIADRGRTDDTAADRAYAEAAWRVVRQTLDLSYFSRWSESALGAPLSYEFEGVQVTPGAIVNALTSSRIVDAVRDAGLDGRPLRILEIGAGYGQVAHQLLQQLDVATYAVCDLPENAFLTAFYLQGNWPARGVQLVADEADAADAELVVTVPPLLGRLEGPWDLVVNTYSFQEMGRESVDAYLAHAAATLAPDGFLYSLNAHGKGGTGIERPSDYAAPGLEIASVAAVRRYPWQLFATVPYEIVLRRGLAQGPGADQKRRLDGLGRAMQFGLHDELTEALAGFGHERAAQLDALADFADDAAPVAERRTAARRAGGAVGAYLDATLALASGDDEAAAAAYEEALPGLPGTHAEVRARLSLAALGGEEAHVSRAVELAPHLEAEIRDKSADLESLRAVLASQTGLMEPLRAAAPSPLGAIARRLTGRHARQTNPDDPARR